MKTLMPESELEVQSDSINTPDDDKTSKNNETDLLDGIPTDEEAAGISEKEDGEDKDKKVPSEIVQKAKYRERWKAERDARVKLETEIAALKGQPGGEKPSDEKEAQAQKYIADIARKAIKDVLAEQKFAEEKVQQAMQDELDDVLDENPDFTEEQIVELMDELKVKPSVAIEVLKRELKKSPDKKKPALPQPKKAAAETKKTGERPKEDEKKSLWDIGQEVKKQIAEKFGGK